MDGVNWVERCSHLVPERVTTRVADGPQPEREVVLGPRCVRIAHGMKAPHRCSSVASLSLDRSVCMTDLAGERPPQDAAYRDATCPIPSAWPPVVADDARRGSRSAHVGVDRGRCRAGWCRPQPDGCRVRKEPRSRRSDASAEARWTRPWAAVGRRGSVRTLSTSLQRRLVTRRGSASRDVSRAVPHGYMARVRRRFVVAANYGATRTRLIERVGVVDQAAECEGWECIKVLRRRPTLRVTSLGSDRRDGWRGSVTGRHHGQRVCARVSRVTIGPPGSSER